MLENNIMDYSAVKADGYTTTREDVNGNALFIGTRDEKVAGIDTRVSVIKETKYSVPVTAEGCCDAGIAKVISGVQIKWSKPNPLTINTTEDFEAQNAQDLIDQFQYLTGITVTVGDFLTAKTAPFFQISGRQS